MRATWRMRRGKLAVASAIAVAIAGLGAGAAIPAAASAGPGAPAKATAGAEPKLVKPTERTGIVPDTVIAVLSGTSHDREGAAQRQPRTGTEDIGRGLEHRAVPAGRPRRSEPLFGGLSSGTARALDAAARQRIGTQALNLGNIVLVHVTKGSALAAATKLAGTSGVSLAEPDRYVQTMDTGGQVLTSSTAPRGTALAERRRTFGPSHRDPRCCPRTTGSSPPSTAT